MIKSVMDPQDYFSSDEYYSFKQLASKVYDTVEPKCKIFLGVVRGTNEGSEIGCPEIDHAMCFPARFLKTPSTATLPEELRLPLDSIIENSFFLGLMCHLFLHSFLTRGYVERVNIDALVHVWGLNTLMADEMMKTYNKEANELPQRVFESYFNTKIKPVLKKQFTCGSFSVGQCHSYFRNLFFSGTLLGLQFDLMTQPTHK